MKTVVEISAVLLNFFLEWFPPSHLKYLLLAHFTIKNETVCGWLILIKLYAIHYGSPNHITDP